MDDIWSIIGLSSLIAAIVTVSLGIVRDVLIERYRFRRQSEAGYIQGQIQVYSQIYFLLKRIEMGAISEELFGSSPKNFQELNDIVKKNASTLESRILSKSLSLMALVESFTEEKEVEKRKEIEKKLDEGTAAIILNTKEIMNNKLIPKYRKIVGETVPSLD